MSEFNQENGPLWWIDESRPGEGDRPDWLPDKFKSLSDLGKSYAELEKKVGIVVDDYDFSKSKFLDPNYGPFQELRQEAKEKRVPAEFLDKLVDSLDKYMDEFSTNYEEELKKLGDNAQERIVTLDNWAKANLSKEGYEALTSNLKSADSIKALEELRGKMMSSNPMVPAGNESANNNTDSLDDLRLELTNNLEKYKTDSVYRKDLQRRLEVASKNTPGFIDKHGA